MKSFFTTETQRHREKQNLVILSGAKNLLFARLKPTADSSGYALRMTADEMILPFSVPLCLCG
jgi:hypothetical protein